MAALASTQVDHKGNQIDKIVISRLGNLGAHRSLHIFEFHFTRLGLQLFHSISCDRDRGHVVRFGADLVLVV